MKHLLWLLFFCFACNNQSSQLTFSTGNIKGGFIPPAGSWPSVGMMTYDGDFLCSCSLISSGLVLTAGHCVAGMEPSKLSIHFPETKLEKRPAPLTRRVAEAFVHEKLNSDTFEDYDIALLQLDEPIYSIDPIPLITQAEWDQYVFNDMPLSLIGFGRTENSLPDGNYRQVDVTLFDIGTTKFKAGNPEQMALPGDSGGPAFIKLPNGSYRQVGLAHKEMNDGYNLYTKSLLLNEITPKLDIYRKRNKYIKQLHFARAIADDKTGQLEQIPPSGQLIIDGGIYQFPPRVTIWLDNFISITVYLEDIFQEIDQLFNFDQPQKFNAAIVIYAEDARYLRLDETVFRRAEMVGEEPYGYLLYNGTLEYDNRGNYHLYDNPQWPSIDLSWNKP